MEDKHNFNFMGLNMTDFFISLEIFVLGLKTNKQTKKNKPFQQIPEPFTSSQLLGD